MFIFNTISCPLSNAMASMACPILPYPINAIFMFFGIAKRQVSNKEALVTREGFVFRAAPDIQNNADAIGICHGRETRFEIDRQIIVNIEPL